MNFTVRYRDTLQRLGTRRLSTHPLESHPNSLGEEQAIVRYRHLFAYIQLRNQYRPRIGATAADLQCAADIPEVVPAMPKSIKMLMYEGVPIGARRMTDLRTGEPYFKFAGHKHKDAVSIAKYLLAIPKTDRKDIFDAMLLNTRSWVVGSIVQEYQNAATRVQRKNLARILAGQALVCDTMGVLH